MHFNNHIFKKTRLQNPIINEDSQQENGLVIVKPILTTYPKHLEIQ